MSRFYDKDLEILAVATLLELFSICNFRAQSTIRNVGFAAICNANSDDKLNLNFRNETEMLSITTLTRQMYLPKWHPISSNGFSRIHECDRLTDGCTVFTCRNRLSGGA